jgi:hypothetical protein
MIFMEVMIFIPVNEYIPFSYNSVSWHILLVTYNIVSHALIFNFQQILN